MNEEDFTKLDADIREQLKVAEELMRTGNVREGIYLKLATVKELEIRKLKEQLHEMYKERERDLIEADLRKQLYELALDRIADLSMKLGSLTRPENANLREVRE